jgi:predicted transcriptional regulator
MGRRAHGTLENEIIAALAVAGSAMTVQEVAQAVDTDLSYTTVHTTLGRLSDKGLVERERTDGGYRYRPAAQAADVLAEQIDALLRRGPDRTAVLRSFLDALTPDDVRFLREWLASRDTPVD